jgi:hypothetical protein
MVSLLPFLLGLLVTAGLVVPALLRLRGKAADAQGRADALEGRIVELKKTLAQAEDVHLTLSQFLKEFPHLSRELFSGASDRNLPGAILRVVQRSLDPAQAWILVRRGYESESGRFVVGATLPEGDALSVGTEVPRDRGEVGVVGSRSS